MTTYFIDAAVWIILSWLCFLYIWCVVVYFRNMPEIDILMQEWPAEFEDLLKEVSTVRCPHGAINCTRKASCLWQTRVTLAKRLHGLCKSSVVVSCIASLSIDSLRMVSYYRPIVTLCLKCTVFEIWRHIGWKLPKKPTPLSFGTFLWGDPLRIFP